MSLLLQVHSLLDSPMNANMIHDAYHLFVAAACPAFASAVSALSAVAADPPLQLLLLLRYSCITAAAVAATSSCYSMTAALLLAARAALPLACCFAGMLPELLC